MAGSGLVGQFFVEYSVKGFAEVQAATAAVGKGLQGLGTVAAGVAHGAASLGAALAPATMTLYGMATAGVAASGAGQLMSFQFAELNRQIASLFVPQINAVIKALDQTIRFFRGLSGEQQSQLRTLGLVAGALTATAVALPMLASAYRGVTAAAAAFQVVSVALVANPWTLAFVAVAAVISAAVLAGSDWKTVLLEIGAIANQLKEPFMDLAAVLKEVGKDMRALRDQVMPGVEFQKFANQVTGLQAVINTYRGIKQALGFGGASQPEARNELAPRAGGFEDVQSTYRRIAQASRFAVKTPEEQAVEELKEANIKIKGVENAVREQRQQISR
jgi:hypothetical protein